jgi:hypothetical protein
VTEVSVVRLNLLRLNYLVLVFGLGSVIWPTILDPSSTWALRSGVVFAMLGALSALAVLGLRYPLQALPLLFFEMGWKLIWLVRMALPLWSAHRLDAATTETLNECLPIVVMPFLIPWGYVVAHYFRKDGDPWRRRVAIPSVSVTPR